MSDPKLTLAASTPRSQRPDVRIGSGCRALAGQRHSRRRRTRPRPPAARRTSRRAGPARSMRRPFMEELAGRLPADAIVFDEALTFSPEVTQYLPPRLPGSFFQTRGGSLGVGIPGAIGAQARASGPDRGRVHRGRRQHVHDPGAVDGGPPPDRRQVRDPQQRRLPAAASSTSSSTGRTRGCRRTTSPIRSTSVTRTSGSTSSPRRWASAPFASRPPTRSARPSTRRSPTTGRS